MAFALNRIGQIALAVRDVDRAAASASTVRKGSRMIARLPDHDLWMAFFSDPDRHTLALMQEAPKGYLPPHT